MHIDTAREVTDHARDTAQADVLRLLELTRRHVADLTARITAGERTFPEHNLANDAARVDLALAAYRSAVDQQALLDRLATATSPTDGAPTDAPTSATGSAPAPEPGTAAGTAGGKQQAGGGTQPPSTESSAKEPLKFLVDGLDALLEFANKQPESVRGDRIRGEDVFRRLVKGVADNVRYAQVHLATDEQRTTGH